MKLLGEGAEEGHKGNPKAGAPLLLRQAEGIELVKLEEKAAGKSHYGLPTFKGSL